MGGIQGAELALRRVRGGLGRPHAARVPRGQRLRAGHVSQGAVSQPGVTRGSETRADT